MLGEARRGDARQRKVKDLLKEVFYFLEFIFASRLAFLISASACRFFIAFSSRRCATITARSIGSIAYHASSPIPRSNLAECSSNKGTMSGPRLPSRIPALTALSSSMRVTDSSTSPTRFVTLRKGFGGLYVCLLDS